MPVDKAKLDLFRGTLDVPAGQGRQLIKLVAASGVRHHHDRLDLGVGEEGAEGIGEDASQLGGGVPGRWSLRTGRKDGRDLIRAYQSLAGSCSSHGTSPR